MLPYSLIIIFLRYRKIIPYYRTIASCGNPFKTLLLHTHAIQSRGNKGIQLHGNREQNRVFHKNIINLFHMFRFKIQQRHLLLQPIFCDL